MAKGESIISLTRFKAGAKKLVDELHTGAGALVLTQNGSARAVVQSYESYRRQQESLVMLRLMAQGEADVQQGRLHDQQSMFDELRAELDQATGGAAEATEGGIG